MGIRWWGHLGLDLAGARETAAKAAKTYKDGLEE